MKTLNKRNDKVILVILGTLIGSSVIGTIGALAGGITGYAIVKSKEINKLTGDLE